MVHLIKERDISSPFQTAIVENPLTKEVTHDDAHAVKVKDYKLGFGQFLR